MSNHIYLDHHATTPVDPRVLKRMLPYFSEHFGNAASRNHMYGWKAEEAVDAARAEMGSLLGCSKREITFTSGATEANNLAILGTLALYEDPLGHIVTQQTEHKSVLDPCHYLASRGHHVTILPVDTQGRVDPEDVTAALRNDTVLVSVMLVNNEVGTVQSVGEIGKICKKRGVLLHCDAAQAAGIIDIDVDALGVDLLSISAHKFYGPKGIGALYARRRSPRVQLQPIVHGGGHERGWRSGTLNVPCIVGAGAAANIAKKTHQATYMHLQKLKSRLHTGLVTNLTGVDVNGPKEGGHPGNLNVSFEGVEAEALIMGLRSIAVSSGAACASATLEPSHVLRAMGVDPKMAHRAIRFGIGRNNTMDEIDEVVARVTDKVKHIRALVGNTRGR